MAPKVSKHYPGLLTAAEAANILGITESGVRQFGAADRFKRVIPDPNDLAGRGPRVYFDEASVREFAKTYTPSPQAVARRGRGYQKKQATEAPTPKTRAVKATEHHAWDPKSAADQRCTVCGKSNGDEIHDGFRVEADAAGRKKIEHEKLGIQLNATGAGMAAAAALTNGQDPIGTMDEVAKLLMNAGELVQVAKAELEDRLSRERQVMEAEVVRLLLADLQEKASNLA